MTNVAEYGLTEVAAPASEPLTTAEGKKHLEIDSSVTAHDTFIASLITATRIYAERYTNRALINTTFDLFLDQFPPGDETILLPRAPLSSVTSVTYVDGDGASQTWSSSAYDVSASREPGRVRLAYSENYPATRDQADAVTVRFVGGYGATASSVPQPIKQAMLLLLGHWFENRESVVVGTIAAPAPLAATALLDSYTFGDWLLNYARR